MTQPAPEISRDQLLAAVRQAGVRVTSAQLRRWCDAGLIPPPRKQGLGRGRGTRAYYHASSIVRVLIIRDALTQRRNIDDAAWALWVAGFDDLTEWVRDLLLAEWKGKLASQRRLLRDLLKGATRQRVIQAARRGRLPFLSGHGAVVHPDKVPIVARMFAELQIGTLHQQQYAPDDWTRLQDVSVAVVFPEVLGSDAEDELPSPAEVEMRLRRLSRDAALPRTIEVLRTTPVQDLCIMRNEMQILLETLLAGMGRPAAFMERDDFLRYFVSRYVDPVSVARLEKLPAEMGWRDYPQSLLVRQWQEFARTSGGHDDG